MAVALGDEDRFRHVWAWTDEHLQRDDGLLAWRWADGGIVDHQAAADADLLAARRWRSPARGSVDADLVADAALINDAVLAHEVVALGPSPVLVAGPWADLVADDQRQLPGDAGDVAALGDARRPTLGAGRGRGRERRARRS